MAFEEMESGKVLLYLVLLLVASIPIDHISLILYTSIPEMMILTISLILTLLVMNNKRIEMTRISILVFILLSLLAILRIFPLIYSENRLSQFKFLLTGDLIVLLYISIFLNVDRKKDLSKVIYIIVASAVIINFINILQGYSIISLPGTLSRFANSRYVLGVQIPVERRGVAVFTAFGSYGLWSIIALSFSFSSVIKPSLFSRLWGSIYSSVIIFGSVLVLQSRNVWVGIAITTASITFLHTYKNKSLKNIYKYSLPLISILSPIIAIKFLKFLINIDKGTLESRMIQYMAVKNVFLEQPILGAGRGIIKERTGFALHSFYLQLLIFNTPIGLMIFLILSIILLKNLGILYIKNKGAYTISLISAFIGSLAISMTYPASSSYIIWMLISIIVIYISIENI